MSDQIVSEVDRLVSSGVTIDTAYTMAAETLGVDRGSVVNAYLAHDNARVEMQMAAWRSNRKAHYKSLIEMFEAYEAK